MVVMYQINMNTYGPQIHKRYKRYNSKDTYHSFSINHIYVYSAISLASNKAYYGYEGFTSSS